MKLSDEDIKRIEEFFAVRARTIDEWEQHLKKLKFVV